MLCVGGLTDQEKAPEVGWPSNRAMGSVWIPQFVGSGDGGRNC